VALTLLLVLGAAATGVAAYLTWDDARSTRDATAPLQVRARALRSDLATADLAVVKLTALFAAVRAQGDATAAAVTLANQAAQHYNNAESGLAAALGADVAATGTSLAETTAAVRSAIADLQGVLTQLAGAASVGTTDG
jgi:hypothetical protein